MTKKSLPITGLLSLLTFAVLTLCAAGGAAAAAPLGAVSSFAASGTPQLVSLATANTDPTGYWTAERMQTAIPGDVLAGKALAGGATTGAANGAVETGPPVKITGTAKGGSPSLHQNEDPIDHVGKVFFTMGLFNYVCSGNAIVSDNDSTVATAGHCVNEGPGAFVRNFVFVPAYLNGTAPYGVWPAKALYTTTQWSTAGDIRYDTGFAVTAAVNGKHLADVVGASGVEFNADRGLGYKAYGYPAAPPFDGQSLKSCSGDATKDPINPQFKAQGIPCDMTGGSSGGPWMVTDNQDCFQNSITSYGYPGGPALIYGPYWGSVIKDAYKLASASR
ncbi:trypsin-like serine peptidase [Arthrobacter sp. NA-172]|uniref:trypsin-like serine peptidase n=1 Tax=Arthrobacter sp. NA-172 TaxID=3367524 RepID=UPI0037546580